MADLKPLLWFIVFCFVPGPPPGQVSCLYCAPRGLSYVIFEVFSVFEFFVFLTSYYLISISNLSVFLFKVIFNTVFNGGEGKIGKGNTEHDKYFVY